MLQEYDFEIVHRSGMANANGCSRCPLPRGEGDEEAIGEMDKGAFYSGEPQVNRWGGGKSWDDVPRHWQEEQESMPAQLCPPTSTEENLEDGEGEEYS